MYSVVKKLIPYSWSYGNKSSFFGFIRGDKKRTLGTLSGKPEPWFVRGGYTQASFPKADYIYGKGEEEDYSVRKTAYVAEIDKTFEAEFQKWENWVPEKDFEEQNTIDENSHYRKAMKYSLMERVDYMIIFLAFSFVFAFLGKRN